MKLFKRLFKGWKKSFVHYRCKLEFSNSCEDENTKYITYPDGLRLIIRNGEYVGWYVCGGEHEA